jgi:hypothetical protein
MHMDLGSRFLNSLRIKTQTQLLKRRGQRLVVEAPPIKYKGPTCFEYKLGGLSVHRRDLCLHTAPMHIELTICSAWLDITITYDNGGRLLCRKQNSVSIGVQRAQCVCVCVCACACVRVYYT